MQITKKTVQRAFESHERVYVNGRAWRIPEIISMWQSGERALAEGPKRDAFEKLYNGLISWQAFRSYKSQPTDEAHEPLDAAREILLPAVRAHPLVTGMMLSELSAANVAEVGAVLEAVRGLKVNKDGPSLVAVSKFLHFLNPRLFVIVDRLVVGDFVLQHHWIRQQVEAARAEAVELGLALDAPGPCLVSNGLRYLDILLWAGDVMRDNPHITETFATYVTEHAKKEHVPSDIREYEAAAFEWLILGLVHLPPEGVKV